MKQYLARLTARAEVYRLLSRGYYAPPAGSPEGDFLASLKKALDTLALHPCAAKPKNTKVCLKTPAPEELAVEYTRLFRGPVKAEVYPYESMYVEGDVMGRSTLDVVKVYREAGVSVSGEFKDLPDHISAELEFMHYLCQRELDALQSGAREEAGRFRKMSQAFLRNHLSRWVPQFTDLVTQHASTPYYLTVAEMTREFIGREFTGDWLDCGSHAKKPQHHDSQGYQ